MVKQDNKHLTKMNTEKNINVFTFSSVNDIMGLEELVNEKTFLKKMGDKNNHQELTKKEDARLFSCSKRHAIDTTDKNGKQVKNYRKDNCIDYLTIIALDIDDANNEDLISLQNSNYLGAVYTTFNSTQQQLRLRVLLSCDRNITKEEYPIVVETISKELNIKVDDSSKKPSQLMYYPSHCVGDTNYNALFFEGTSINIDSLLSRAEFPRQQEEIKAKKAQLSTTQTLSNSECSETPIHTNTTLSTPGFCNLVTLSGIFNTYFFKNPSLIDNHLTNYYDRKNTSCSSTEICRWARKGSSSQQGLILRDDGLISSYHSNDEASKKNNLTPFQLFGLKTFGNLKDDDNYKNCCEYIKTADEFKTFRESDVYREYNKQYNSKLYQQLKGLAWDRNPIMPFPVPDDYKIPEIEYLVEGFIEKDTLNFLCGEGGVGKSTLGDYIVASLIGGYDVFGRKTHMDTQRRGVLFINTEEGAQPKVRLAGISKELNITPEKGTNLTLINVYNEQVIREYIEQGDISVVVYEPLHGLTKQMNDEGNFYEALHPFVEISQKLHVTFLLIHHPNKMGGISGTHAIVDTGRNVWMMEKAAQDEINLTCAKVNDMKYPKGIVIKRNEGYTFSYVRDIETEEAIQAQKEQSRKEMAIRKQIRQEQKANILDLHNNQNLTPKQISQQLNLSIDTVKNAIYK